MLNIRNFFIAFFISLITFSIFAWLLIRNISDVQIGNNNETPVNSGNTVIQTNSPVQENEIKGNSFTALLACTDELTNRHDALIILHVDKERKQYMISTLPSYMVLNIDSIEYYLGDLINEKGREFLLDKVYAITGLKIDYYAFVSLNGFKSIIDEVGGITFTVPQNMFYKDHNENVLVDLKKGTQKLDGNKALQLLRYKDYSTGDEERRNIHRDFIFTSLDSILSMSNISKASGVFDKLIDNVYTNFNQADLINNIDLIFMYNQFEKIEIDYPGVSNEGEDVVRFIPKIDEAINIYKNHR